MDRVDSVVVGAGVVGLAVARALAQSGREVVVLEQALAIGTGVSSRNSEVVHAGLYYAPGSHKARLCVRGKALLYDFCATHGVAHRRCGKLVVATDDAQLPALQALARKADANDVPVQWLDTAQAQALEPALQCRAALFSPTTGIVDSHAFMLALQGDLEAAGGMVALGSRCVAASPSGGGWGLRVRTDDGAAMALDCREWVNAAGLWACGLAQQTEGLAPAHRPTAHYAKGSYFTLAGRSPFQHLIYPAPQDAWLGVHLTLDLAGQARFGPDLEWLRVDGPDGLDYRVDPERAQAFYAEVRRYWPALPDGALQPAYSGVRPKIHGPGEPAPDFRLDGPGQHGLPGLVNLLGIESPGLTSALAIGEEVRRLLDEPA